MLHLGDKPGLGVEPSPDEAGKNPYEQAYLPYNRLADGTVHDLVSSAKKLAADHLGAKHRRDGSNDA